MGHIEERAESRVDLRLKYPEREAAKAAGARWDKEAKVWYAPAGAPLEPLAQWLPRGQHERRPREAQSLDPSNLAFVLHVPYEPDKAAAIERNKALKSAGAAWGQVDGKKAWFAKLGAEEALEAWRVAPPPMSASVAGSTFEDAMRAAGLVVDQAIKDGKWHRADLADGKPKNKNGSYICHEEGSPRGSIQNFVTGELASWHEGRPNHDAMSPSHKAAWAAQTALSRLRREAESEAQYETASAQASARWESIPDLGLGHPYLERKNALGLGARVDGEWLVIPIQDINGKIQSLQMISADPDGPKLFLPGGRTAGGMFLIGEVAPGQDILIAEGFATGSTLHEATALPVAVAFNAGNLLPVAKALAKKYPDSMIAFMADDDRFGKFNTGMEKAKAAATLLRGAVASPRFSEGSAGKPTDWNDLLNLDGLAETRAQISAALKSERARLATERAAEFKANHPDLEVSIADTRSGSYRGTPESIGSGLCALIGRDGKASVHEFRRFDAALRPGAEVSVAYRDRLAQVGAPADPAGRPAAQTQGMPQEPARAPARERHAAAAM